MSLVVYQTQRIKFTCFFSIRGVIIKEYDINDFG